jgi:hypothetical protein
VAQVGQKSEDMEAKASKHASKCEHACARIGGGGGGDGT